MQPFFSRLYFEIYIQYTAESLYGAPYFITPDLCNIILYALTLTVRGSTLVCGRQILTTKVDLRTVRVNISSAP